MFISIITFLTVGWVFWVLLPVLFLCILFTADGERFVSNTLLTVSLVGLAFVHFSLAFSPLTYLLGIVGYLTIGSLWALWRWRKFVNKAAVEFNKAHGKDDTTTESYRIYHDYLVRDTEMSNMKSRIYIWIIDWPWSVLWNIVGDTLDQIVAWMSSLFGRITKKALSTVAPPALNPKV